MTIMTGEIQEEGLGVVGGRAAEDLWKPVIAECKKK